MKTNQTLRHRKQPNKPGARLSALAFSLFLPFSQSVLAQQAQPQATQQAAESPGVASNMPMSSELMLEQPAAAWLVKMQQALQSLNYQISFVVLKPGSDAIPYVWRHGVRADGTELEQLNLLNGPGREMVRVGNQVSYFEPNAPQYTLLSEVINGPLPGTFFNDPMALQDGYDFVIVGRGRVSGRAAQQVRVISKDKNRFGFNLWLDQATGLPLKVNMVNLNGKLIEQIQVTELQVTPQPHPFFERIVNAELPAIVSLPHLGEQMSRWAIDYLPLGMELVRRDVHRLPLTGQPVEYIMLSDGLVDVSVYMQESSAKRSQDDALLHYFESDTFLIRHNGSVMVTVIGKIPPATANAIAASVRERDGG